MPDLPRGYRARPPTPSDVRTVTTLLCACDVAESGAPDTSESDLAADWTQPRFDLSRDAWLVEHPAGPPVAYAYLWDRADHADLDGDIYVHPEEDFVRLGGYLLEQIERRAKEHAHRARAETSPRLMLHALAGNGAYRKLVTDAGFRPVRIFLRMTIDIPRDIAEPALPRGVRVSSVADGIDPRAIHDVVEHAFESHFLHNRLPYDEWKARYLDHDDYEPSLWFAAHRGDELAGVVLAYDYGDTGFVRELGVRPGWRGRGLGLALLQTAFRALVVRGQTRCDLGVDAENATGAPRLYKSAGMRVAYEIVMYEKRLATATVS